MPDTIRKHNQKYFVGYEQHPFLRVSFIHLIMIYLIKQSIRYGFEPM
jgi:hypothetical protein